MNASIVALLLLAACAAAAPNGAGEEEVGNNAPLQLFHPHLPPWLHHRTTTKKPTATTEGATTTTITEEPSTTAKAHKTTTTTLKPTTKPHKTTTTTLKPTTKPHKTTTTTLKPTTKPHQTTTPRPTTTTSTPTTTELPPFRGDYTLVGNFGYYKLHKEYKSTWAEAWQGCIDEDAHLLVVRSREEFNALYQWIPNEMPPYVYYGAHHRYANHKFVTIFDEPLETVPYHDFGWDYSNTTYFNNKDFPVLLIDLSISWGSTGIFLTEEYRNEYQFICKKDI